MDFNPESRQLSFTAPERYQLGIGVDKPFPLEAVEELYDTAVYRLHQLMDQGGSAEKDLSLIEELTLELGDIREHFREDIKPPALCTKETARVVGCAALSDDSFELRQAVRRRSDVFRQFNK